jgi:hypothetical protein
MRPSIVRAVVFCAVVTANASWAANRVSTVAMMMSGTAADGGVDANRSFLMLNDQSVEFVDGAPVLGYWRTGHRWNAKEQRLIEIVDGVEFPMDRQFWKMVKENDAKYSAAADVRIEKDGRLLYRGKPVEAGLTVGRLVYVLRWRDWIVAVGSAADPKRSTIKGPIWYLLWFGDKSLKGSYRQVSDGSVIPLRIYSK